MSTDDDDEETLMHADILRVTVWFVRVDFHYAEQRPQQKPRHLLYTGVLLTAPNMNSFNKKAGS